MPGDTGTLAFAGCAAPCFHLLSDGDKTPASTSREELDAHPARRIVAAILAAVIALTFVLSSLTVAGDLHHDCTGDGCAVCAEVAGCLHFGRIGAVLASVSAAALSFHPLRVIRVLGDPCARHARITLVGHKVQLND